MPGPKRWPPLLIPQLPPAWIRAGILVAVVGSLLLARDGVTTDCGFGAEMCHPWLAALGSFTVAVFWFWLLAPVSLIALGVAHVTRAALSWIRLDVLRPRRG